MTLTLQEALGTTKAGWEAIITKYFDMVALLPNASVASCGYRSGMLAIKGASSDPLVQDLLDRLSHTFERTSAGICEVCGKWGQRRKILPGCPNRCPAHFIDALNDAVANGWTGYHPVKKD